MRLVTYILFIVFLYSCKSKDIKYSGLNDLVIGVQQLILYENDEFYLELGAGGEYGKYKIINDTIILDYDNKPENWPDKILITHKYFETISLNDKSNGIKIKRTDENNYKDLESLSPFDLTEKFKLRDLKKSNEYPSSIIDTVECFDWQLSEQEVINILKNVQPITGSDWHNFYGHWNCCMNADLIQNNITYKLSINAGAWLAIFTDDTTYYFGGLNKELEKLFLSNSWTVDEME